MQNLTQLGVSFRFSYRVFIRKHDVGLRKERAIARRMKTKMEAINYCCFSIPIVKYDHCLTRPDQVVVKRQDDAWGCTGMHMLALIALYSQELMKDTQKKMLLGIISILI